MGASWQTTAALLVVVIAASIAYVVVVAAVVAASEPSVTVALTEGFVAAVAVVSIYAAEAQPVVGDYDPGTAWGPASEEAVVLPADALYLLA